MKRKCNGNRRWCKHVFPHGSLTNRDHEGTLCEGRLKVIARAWSGRVMGDLLDLTPQVTQGSEGLEQ